jgi:hypothetical protein
MATQSELFVNQIISNAIATAQSATSEANAAARAAQTASMGYAMSDPLPVAYTLGAVEPIVLDAENSTLTFESQRDRIIALLSDELAGFFIKYYPLAADAFDEATNWLVNSITNGGTGIDSVVEEQIWQRGRDRVVIDGLRAESQVMNDFASRGFGLPSGAMAARLQEIRFEQLGKTQEMSREAAIKQADMTVENLRFAVGMAIDSRMRAMQAATDYIRSLMSGTDIAARVASINSDAKARMMGATADLYRARLARDELAMKIPLANSDLGIKAQTVNVDGFYRGIDARTAAAGHAADVYGKTALAALSSLSAIGSSTASTFS